MNDSARMRWPNSSSDNRKSKSGPADEKRPRRLKWAGFLLMAFVLVVAGAVAQAQQPKKVSRIGYLSQFDAAT